MAPTHPSINRIAFINLEGQVSTVDPTGNNLRVLTDLDSYFQFPAWSPDGTALAAIGGERAKAGLFLLSDQAKPRPTTPLFIDPQQPPFYLYWSPDSRWISFIANDSAGGIGLHLASVADKKSHRVTSGQPFFWDWTPDSQHLLIHTGGNGPQARLAFIDQAGQTTRALPRPALFQAPGVAPSGQRWAYATFSPANSERLVVADSTGEVAEAPYQGALILSWSPRHDRLAFISPSEAIQQFYGPLRLLDLTTGQVEVLAQEMILAFFWAPDGNKIAYLRLSDTYSQEVGLDEADSDSPVHTNGRSPALSPTSQLSEHLVLQAWVVNVATGRQRRLISFEPPSLFVNQFMPFFDQYALSHRLWSPDSQALLLPIVSHRRLHLTVVPIDGSPVHSVAEGVIGFWSWQ